MLETKHQNLEHGDRNPELSRDLDLKIKAYELGLDQNFSNLFALSVLILSPKRDSVLVEYRKRDQLYAVISGKGALDDNPHKPIEAAINEIIWDTGEKSVIPTEFYVQTNVSRERNGIYVVTVNNIFAVITNPEGHGTDRVWVAISDLIPTKLAFEHNEIINTLALVLTK